MAERLELGQRGEELAARFLRDAGYAILERNVRSRLGEIDLVALDGVCYVFVEVRTLRSTALAPEESITGRKRHRMAVLGQQYLQAHAKLDVEWRADVIAIEMGPEGKPTRIEHYVNAVEE